MADPHRWGATSAIEAGTGPQCGVSAGLGGPRPRGGDARMSGAADPTAGTDKAEILRLAEEHLCPDRVRFMRAAGMELVIGRREGYRIWDLAGKELLDLHLNGGVYNLGHRNPEVGQALVAALATLDIGNHHFPSTERALLAEQLVRTAPGMKYAVFAVGGGEAVDLALKSARRATGRSRIVSVTGSYHGHTGLALGPPATSRPPAPSAVHGPTNSPRLRSTTPTDWPRNSTTAMLRL